MQRKMSIAELKIILVALLLFAGFLSRGGLCSASGPEPPVYEGRIEAVVIHVDQYAVYAPNLVFYFDPQMDQKKLEALKRVADQLRNKKAMITYSSTGDPGRGKRFLLSDIVSAEEKPNLAKPGPETAKPPGDAQGQLARNLSEEQVSPTEIAPPQPNDPPKQAALQEVKQNLKAAQSDPITREEISAFVRRLLSLNGSKDLAAVAPFYADKVDYYDRGVVSRDKVLRDLSYYFRNWAQIDMRVDGDVLMTGFDPEVRIVKFISSFSVKNEKKSIAGKTENIWKIQRINGELKLIDVKEKILEKSPSGF